MTQFIVVFVTCPKRQATRLARKLVEQRVAACVNVIPQVESFFWWQGKIDRAHETLLVIKTAARAFERLRRAVCAGHPYDVPEVLALPITAAHHPYLAWLQDSIGAASEKTE